VRAFIIKAAPFHNNLLLRTKFTPKHGISVQDVPFERGTLVEIDLYGVSFLLNLEEQPRLDLNDQLRAADFISLRLSGTSSWQTINVQMVPDAAMLQGLPEKYWPKREESVSTTESDDTGDIPAPEDSSGSPRLALPEGDQGA
jgi:hypothetical protein